MIPLKLELCCAAMNVLYNVRVPRTIRTEEREEKAARFWWYLRDILHETYMECQY